MGVDTSGLFAGQAGNGRVEFLHGDFALVNLAWGEGDEQGRVLNAVLPVKGIVGLMAVCTQTVGRLPAVKLRHCLRYLIRHFNKGTRCIVRVKIPKIDVAMFTSVSVFGE